MCEKIKSSKFTVDEFKSDTHTVCYQFDLLGESKMVVEEQVWEENENALRWTETHREPVG